MIVAAIVYFAGMFFLLRHIDRRMRSAQAAREAAFLREGFGPASESRRAARQCVVEGFGS
jgi:hypothetical protein